VTNSITLTGEIEGGKLTFRGNTDPNTMMVFALQQSSKVITGQFKSGQSDGIVQINLHDSYLLDANPETSANLAEIQWLGNDLFKRATLTDDARHFPAESPLRDRRYVYVPGMVQRFSDFSSDKRVLLFEKPRSGVRVIAVFGMDKVVRKVPREEFERQIKEQTGRTIWDLQGLVAPP
jgi:hypothetical protein